MPTSEIAWRFRRSPRHIQRVLALSEIPRTATLTGQRGGLRPVERCVLNAREAGSDYPEIAARLRRTPAYVERVEELANFKLRRREETDR